MTEHEFALLLASRAAAAAGRPAPTAQDKLTIRVTSCGESEERVFGG